MSSKVDKALKARAARLRGEKTSGYSYVENDKVKQALEEREKRNKSNISSILSDIQSRYDQEVEAYKSYVDSYKSNSYGQEAYKNTVSSQNDRRVAISKLKSELEGYSKYIGDYSTVNKTIAQLDQMIGGYDSIASNAKYYSQWETEDDYNKAVEEAKKYQEEQHLLSTYDLKSYEYAINDLESLYEKVVEYDKQAKGGDRNKLVLRDTTLRKRGFKDLSELRSHIDNLRETYNKSYVVQNTNRVDPDSEYYGPESAQWVEKGKAISNPSMDEASGTNIFGIRFGDEEVQNPVTYTRDNWSEYEKKSAKKALNGGVSEDVYKLNSLYMQMKEEEVNAYSMLLAQDKVDGGDRAEKYLNALNETLEKRKAGKLSQPMIDEPAVGILFNTAYSFGSFFEDMGKLITNTEGEKSDPSVQDYMSSIIASENKDAWGAPPEWMGLGDSWYNVASDTTGTIGYMLPSILAAKLTGGASLALGASSATAGTIGAVVGSGSMGMASAGSGYQEMLDLGYSKEQARTYGVMIGAAEGLTSYALSGISAVGGKLTGNFIKKAADKIDNAIGRFAVNLGGKIGSEILEEEIQLWLEPAIQSMVLDVDFDAPTADEMLYTALVTAFSTFLLEGPGTVSNEANTVNAGKNLKANGEVERLVELGKTYSADTVAYKLADKVNEDTGAYTIGRLFNEMGASLSSQNVSDITKALVEKGFTQEQAEVHAKWMSNVVEGGNLTNRQQMALESNDVLAEVLYGTIIQPNSTVMQRNQAVNQLRGIESSVGIGREAFEASQTPEAISQSVTQRMAYKYAVGEELVRGANPRKGLSTEQLSEIDAFAAKSRTAIPESNYKDVGQSVSYKPSSAKIADTSNKVSDTGSTIVKSTGEETSIKKIASIDAKNKTMRLELSNGTVVDNTDISYGDEKQAVLYESVLLMGYDVNVANAIVQGFDPEGTISVKDYLIGANESFNYGWGHIPEKGRTGSSYKALPESLRKYAVKLGEDARAADDNARGIKASQNQPQNVKKKSKGGYGAKLAVDGKSVTSRVKESVKALDAVAKALKLNIIVEDLGGKRYGYYRRSTNELVVDVNAGGNGKNTLLFTASHELVHYVRNWSPDKFTILADFLMEQYAANGENIDGLIQEEIDKAYAATRGKHKMSYDEAYEEVVAQAMQRFLTDSNFIEHLASLQKKDASLAKRLVAKLKEILKNIRAAYQGMDTRDQASQAVKEMGDAIEELYAKMEQGLIAASEASQSIGSRNLEDFSEAKNTDGEDLFQYKAMEADEEAYRQMLKKHGIMSEQDINKLFSTIDKALVIIKNNLEVLDYAWEADIDDRSFSPVKPNSDNLYKVSLDFSTLCRKRILQQVIQTQLQDALNKPLSREESIAIRDELMKIQEEGRQIEIACALCYVESARMKSPAQVKKFLKNREAVIKEFLASKSGGDIKQKIKQAEADARERLGVGDAFLKSMPKKVADQIRAAKKEAKKAYTPTAEEQKLIDAASSMTVTDFTSPEGLENLAKNYPVLFDAYTSYVRNATKSKGIEKDTWWRAGDSNSIGDTLIANMNRENGLRSQSWSDFQVIHLLDYIAATIELSTRNAKEQAYSKVPDYIDLMGNTGVMLNMSLIPTAQFNGKLEYDGVEGMAYKKALELRDKYHATAGTICIGISNEQIKMLLDDSTIDYVIPYHRSGMAAHIRKLMHIPTWSEYEDYQSEKELSRDEAEKHSKKYGVTLLSESDPNYHKHTDFSEWFSIEEARQIAKQENAFPTDAKLQKKYGVMYGSYMAMKNAANNYLKLCAERGLSPKFSHENANFTTEDNYWKLLIDRKMVDNVTGEIIEQQAIKPIFDEGEVLRILNDELERYPGIKADQDYATRTVVEKFLSGKMNDRLDPDTIAAIMQKPVDNITTTNIVASEDDVRAQYAEGEMFEEDKYYARQIDKWEFLKDRSFITVGVINKDSPLNQIGMESGKLYFDVSKIKEAMSDHKDHLSKAILKDIPKLLNNPIVIVEYNVGKNMNTANVYGELYYHGTPITVGIVATLSRGKTIISKVRTVHARRDFATQITDDSVLFLGENKKETNRWFQAEGQLVPMGGTKYGFIRSIHDTPPSVKTNQKISTTLDNAKDEMGEADEPTATAEYADIVNTEDLKSQYIDTDETYSYIGKEILGYNEGDRKPDLTLVEVVNERTGLTETTIKFYGEKPKNYVPKKIAYCYKLFEQHPDGTLHALFAGASNATPIGEWVYSQGFPYTDSGVKGMNLRERYGWHLSAGLPSAPHLMSPKAFERGYPSKKAYGHPKDSKRVWVRMAYDATTDFNSIADSTRKGDIFGLIPFGGYYAFKENNQSEWVISSAVKIDKILTEDERQQILKEAGYDEYEAWRKKHHATEEEKAEAKRKSAENKKAKDKAAKAGLNYLSESSKAMREAIKSRIIDNPELDDVKHQYIDSAADQAYMDAVNRGDMDTVQKMVDDAAKKAGYTIKAYHGTNAEFTVFDKNRVGKGVDQYGAGFYFASNPDVTASYGTKRYDTYLNIKKPISLISKHGGKGKTLYDVRITQAQAYQILKRHPLMYDSESSPLGDFYDKYWEVGAKEWMVKDLAKKYNSIGLLDRDVILFRDYPNELHEAIRDVLGYDGVQVYFDTDAMVDERNDYFYVAWFDNQMKSAEPTTYDEDGNIIPLSERFNSENNDIRYQYEDIDAIDNRTILSKSLEGAAKTDIEKAKLKEYQSKIDLINSEEKKLRELRSQIKEVSFSKGTRDTEKLKKLRLEANQSANRINVYDKQLLRLEATKPLMNVLQREKDLVRKKMDQKRKDAVKAAKEKDMETIRELMDRHQESRKKAIEGRDKTLMRHKIKSIVNDLNQLLLKGTKDKHVMIGLQKAVASALDAVNMDTVSADGRVAKYNALIAKAKDPDVIASLTASRDRIAEQGDKMSDKLTSLKNAYREIKNSNDPLIANSHDEVIENKIQSVVDSVGNTPLRDMTLSQLEDVYDMYKMVLTTIRNSNKAFKMDKTKTIAILGNNIMGEIHGAAGEKQYTPKALEGLKSFGWSSLKPMQAFEVIGSGTFKKVFENVRAGEDTWATDVNEAREYYREKSSKYGYDSWDFEQRFEFTSKSGKKFYLSLEQIMSLYAYSKRKQADLHLEQGGFVFDEAIEVEEKKMGIPIKYKVNTANAYSISKEELGNIIGSLSDRQRFFVDEMQAYLSDVMGEKGNEVSLEMYGVKMFKERFYFPLKSAKQFMFEQNEVAGEVRIKNSGFSKETVAKANNPIILSNFMDVWSKHVNDMSMYHSFVLPLEDFNRVFNYKTPASDKYNPESVKSYLQNAYGTQPVAYIKQLLTDLNGGARSDASAGFVNKGIALFKKGSVFASASVVIQQPSAIARAFAYINPKYFVTAKVDLTKHSRDWEECKQYAPVARIKEMGYFDTNVGPQTTEWITAKEYKGFKEKIKGLKDSNYRDELLSKAPALADEITWTHIWNAVKKEIASTTNLKVGSEEFLKRAGERFTEVVVNTQVYDSVLTRSGLMRSKDTGVKMATAFMAEPTTSLNMIVNAFVQAKRGNKRLARNIVGGVASSIILNSILVSIIYAARDDDEDETYAEKYLGSLISELLDGFNPITYIPFAKDIWSIAQGYDVERSDMSVYSKMWESFEELFDENKSVKEKVTDFSGSVATLFGFPLKNIMRDINAVINLATNDLGSSDTTKAGLGYSVSDALRNSIPLLGRFYEEDTKAQKLYDAIIGGDATEIDRAKSGFKNQDAIDTALRTALRENDPRIKEAAQARIDGDISKYKSIAMSIISERNFSQDLVVGAVNAEINFINKGADDANSSSDDEIEESKETSIYKASDINAALENGDTSAALEVINDLVKVKTNNYIAEGEKKKDAEKKAKSSVKSSVTSYWKSLYLAAYKSKNSTEMARIRKLLNATKLYDNVVETCQDWVKQSK